MPYFAPGFNFTRGFWQWKYVRGMQQDRWRSVHTVADDELARYGDPSTIRAQENGYHHIVCHRANTRWMKGEEDSCTARTFQWAMQFLEDNRGARPFYLLVDTFTPHEPWEAPEKYYRMYADPDYDGETTVHVRYGSKKEQGMSDAELANIVAHYSGLVTLLDTWFGKLLDKLDALGLADDTVVIFTSDHGTHFADNPLDIVGKPAYSLWPGVMHLPLLVRWPGAEAGAVRDELVSNVDLPATVYDACGVENHEGIDGRSLRPLITGEGDWTPREYLTCRYADALCCIDDDWWLRTRVDGKGGELFDLRADPDCQTVLDPLEHRDVWDRAWQRLLADAGGEIPVYEGCRRTDAVGQPPESHAP